MWSSILADNTGTEEVYAYKPVLPQHLSQPGRWHKSGALILSFATILVVRKSVRIAVLSPDTVR